MRVYNFFVCLKSIHGSSSRSLVNNQFLLHTALNETFSKLSCKILFRFPFLKNRFGQYFLKNLLCAIKTGFSGATRGGANQVPPPPLSAYFAPLTPNLTSLQHDHDCGPCLLSNFVN